MAKYDNTSGCGCGLYRECQCDENNIPNESFLSVTNGDYIYPFPPPPSPPSPEKNMVNHPEHYNPGVYEAINIIEHYELGFHLGNSVKYILRCGKKNDNVKEEIEKAIWYLKRFIGEET